jgi:hypothetical protein
MKKRTHASTADVASLSYRENEVEYLRVAGEALRFDFPKLEKSNPRISAEQLYEFKRFMILKALYKDTNCSILSPSAEIDAVWHAILLHPVKYVRLCDLLLPTSCCNRVIDHNPEGAMEDIPQQERYTRTLIAYRTFFKEDPNAEMWPPAEETPPAKKAATRKTKTKTDGDTKITLVLMEVGTGDELICKVSTTLLSLLVYE